MNDPIDLPFSLLVNSSCSKSKLVTFFNHMISPCHRSPSSNNTLRYVHTVLSNIHMYSCLHGVPGSKSSEDKFLLFPNDVKEWWR
ncbi:hypothetical protein NC652_038078 [Populus alba x Populus x berolinensis]|nr:hypothetical protein NC652_038078 [Populus alba x Populus x berolinensis]